MLKQNSTGVTLNKNILYLLEWALQKILQAS